MSPAERKAKLSIMMAICEHLGTIRVSEDKPYRICVADIRQDLRAGFEQYLLGSACPEQGYAYVHDFYRWSRRFSRAASNLTVPLVSEEPAVTVSDWNLVRFPREEHWHLMGRTVPDGRTRRTSFIEEFDLQNMRLLTASGRLYHLMGKPCRDEVMEERLALQQVRELGGETWV